MSTTATLPNPTTPTTFDVSSTTPVPLSRLIQVEMRKLVDTRSGRWLLMIQAVLIVVASAIVLIVGVVNDESVALMDLIGIAGAVMGLLLPVMGIMAITSEWSQRTNMSTFTLEPRRTRVVTAKLVATVAAALASVAVAITIGYVSSAIGELVGVDLDWNANGEMLVAFAVVQVLGLLVGFMFGTLLLNTPGAIVAYVAYFTLVPAVLAGAAELMGWFHDLRPWIDFADAQMPLNDFGQDSDELGFGAVHWGQFAVSGMIWFALPLWLGITRILRAEVK
jgi:ABC-2 type transport system permease protein